MNDHQSNRFIKLIQSQSKRNVDEHTLRPIIMLYNTGRHMYYTFSMPRWFKEDEPPFRLLSYAVFLNGHTLENGLYVQSFGHKFHHFGGSAKLYLWYKNTQWDVHLPQCVPHYLIETTDTIGLYKQRRSTLLPRKLFVLE